MSLKKLRYKIEVEKDKALEAENPSPFVYKRNGKYYRNMGDVNTITYQEVIQNDYIVLHFKKPDTF